MARLTGVGTFEASTSSGLTCRATYDALTRAPILRVPVYCIDGRAGALLVTWQTDLVAGTAIAQLDDGTEGQFVFGNGMTLVRTVSARPIEGGANCSEGRREAECSEEDGGNRRPV